LSNGALNEENPIKHTGMVMLVGTTSKDTGGNLSVLIGSGQSRLTIGIDQLKAN
jgi:hypothetical protein